MFLYFVILSFDIIDIPYVKLTIFGKSCVLGESLDFNLNWCYLHFGGFSNNDTLKGFNLYLYRMLTIGIHNGFKHYIKSVIICNKISKLCKIVYKLLKLKRYNMERAKFSWQ